MVGWELHKEVEKAAENVARLVGVDSDEVFFTSGATESNNLALLGLGRRAIDGDRHRVLVSAIEHKCVIAASRVLAEQHGFLVEVIPVDEFGFVSLETLKSRLDEDVLLVSAMAVNNEIGTIQDIPAIASAIHSVGAIFHCDAAQAPLAISTQRLAEHVDLLSLSAHKMYGPQGIGALIIRRHLHRLVEPLVYGGGQQKNIRSGTLPVALCVGMSAASELMCDQNKVLDRENLRRKTTYFIEQLGDLNREITVNGPSLEQRHPGNANICFRGLAALDLLQVLQPKIAAATGSACTTGTPEPSHVLRAIGLNLEEADASIRFSLGFETKKEELEQAVGLIGDAIDKLHRAT